MPRNNLNRYYMPGGYSQRTITHMSRMAYARSANSTAMYARPYATADSLIQRVDGQGEDWYHDEANDLHLRDFIWFAQMQTACRMQDRGTRVRNIDRVLNQLLVEGIFDREEPNMRSAAEEMSMAHSAAMVQRLLMRIKSLEHRVRLPPSRFLLVLITLPAQPGLPIVPRSGTMCVWQSFHRGPSLRVHARAWTEDGGHRSASGCSP